MEKIKVVTNKKNEMVIINRKIDEIIKERGWQDGVVIIFTPHTTAAITINENADEDVKGDLLRGLDKMIPDIEYKHAEGNSDAHIKSSIVGASESVIIENGKMELGIWQGIYFCEFDGPRVREVYIKFIGK